ncbi:hypothetical protein BLOT_003209, partial [Blomia tropicalis]
YRSGNYNSIVHYRIKFHRLNNVDKTIKFGHSMSKRLKKSDLVDELERSSSSKIGQHDDHDLDGE